MDFTSQSNPKVTADQSKVVLEAEIEPEVEEEAELRIIPGAGIRRNSFAADARLVRSSKLAAAVATGLPKRSRPLPFSSLGNKGRLHVVAELPTAAQQGENGLEDDYDYYYYDYGPPGGGHTKEKLIAGLAGDVGRHVGYGGAGSAHLVGYAGTSGGRQVGYSGISAGDGRRVGSAGPLSRGRSYLDYGRYSGRIFVCQPYSFFLFH